MIDLFQLALAVHLRISRRDDMTWEVGSADSFPDSFHTVAVADSGLWWRCDCEDFRIQPDPCTHVIRVGLANGDPTVIEGLRMLIPDLGRRF